MKEIFGRFARVSDFSDRTGPVLVGFCGDVYPHDLRPEHIEYIKAFYNRAGWGHRFYNEWPEEIKPAYPAAKAKGNFKNGFMLIYREEDRKK